jgi:hypothetical protein
MSHNPGYVNFPKLRIIWSTKSIWGDFGAHNKYLDNFGCNFLPLHIIANRRAFCNGGKGER